MALTELSQLTRHQLRTMIGLKYKALALLLLLFVSTKTIKAQPSVVNIGSISEIKGNAQVVRDKPYGAALNFDIQQLDNVKTAQGRVKITFADATTVSVLDHSKLIIDSYVYDPDPTKSEMAMRFASGSIRFSTGLFNNKKNIKISTDSADIFVRGTSFSVTAEHDTGSSLIILLPDENGDPSGEITVKTAMGEVILNQAFQATTARTFNDQPSKPVILDISLDLIDNMMIVNPPKSKKAKLIEVQQTKSADYLEFNDLDVDFLAEDFLDNEEELQFTELDINYLDTNFLEDLLNIIDALAVSDEEDKLAQVGSINIVGTAIGQDKDTQITTFITGEVVTLLRNVSDYARLDLDGADSYTVILNQGGVENVIKINGGSNNIITIYQGS